jgi:ribonuclease HI
MDVQNDPLENGDKSERKSLEEVLRIFTDGMSLHAGTKSHIGVYSVWIDNNNEGNHAWWTKDGTITNQSMELAGVNAGLETIRKVQPVTDDDSIVSKKKRKNIIYSTSHYVLNCMTKWLPRWENTGWITKQKRQVHNGVMLRHMADISREYNVEFVRVPPELLSMESTSESSGYIDPIIIKGMRSARDAMMDAAAEGTHSGCTKQRGQMTCDWSGG